MAIVALGTFDGMHAGHRALLDALRKTAEAQGEEACIHTFSNHPRAVFAKAPALLCSDEKRLAMLGETGCRVVAEPFTADYAAMEPEAFARMLVERLHMRTAVTGFNYTFGAQGRGNVGMLKGLGERLGFSLLVVEPSLYGGEPVSSTRIRKALEEGDIQSANAMLARPFSMEGEVVHNRAIGRRLGFPTANLLPGAGLATPRKGVYASLAELGGRFYRAVTNVGENPTVGGRALSVETHLLEGGGDLYGRYMRVHFLGFLRPETRFAHVEALKAQIARDKEAAKRALAEAAAR